MTSCRPSDMCIAPSAEIARLVAPATDPTSPASAPEAAIETAALEVPNRPGSADETRRG